MHETPRQFGPLPPVLYAIDFSAWKRPVVGRCFPSAHVKFVRAVNDIPEGGTAVIWGRRDDAFARRPDVRLLRLEDGFLRSVGLGVDLIRPLSWVVDTRGMYYDATRPSDLEHFLAHHDFTRAEIERAARLRQRIVAERLTKYNVGTGMWQRPERAIHAILVVGQVESDAALAYGAPGIRGNLALLRAVREDHPQAHVVYKPHPDVLAGMRASGVGEDDAAAWCDEVVSDAPMHALLDSVDEVHVMTSLAGFEALLRDKPVTCHGQPFYSGWGLTRDRIPHPRRTRLLTLDELVAAALIAYPLYFSRDGQQLITPEQALDELLAWRSRTGSGTPWWRKAFRVALRRVVGVR